MSDPFAEIDRLAALPTLLVACDYDGTLAPIVEDPPRARPAEGAIEAVADLASLPSTHVVLVSGRSRSELARLSDAPRHVQLVGSHGGELGREADLTPEQAELRGALHAELERIAEGFPGAWVEPKPFGAAFHYRRVAPERREEAGRAAEDGPGTWEGVSVRPGKMVLELAVREADKGTAFRALVERLRPSAAVYLGDDRTDEDVFRVLGPDDVGIKVGEGESTAGYRLDGPESVTRFLDRLAETRRANLALS